MSGMAAIIPIESETLGKRVYTQLRQMLIGGHFAPGESMTLRDLAKAIGTSPMPVRDALRQLLSDQAIELLPNRMFRVPLMTRARFYELREIRLNVEGLAVEHAALHITEEELAEAAECSRLFNEECAKPEPDPSKLFLYNKNLHFGIYRAARMPSLLQIIEGLWAQVGPVLKLDIRPGSERVRNQTPCEHHERLVQALRDRNSKGAREALVTDLYEAGEAILSLISPS
jgi:DNA-binding GntR family transcriptional regulator